MPNSLTLLSYLHGPPEAPWKPLPGKGKWGPEATSVGFSIGPKSLSCLLLALVAISVIIFSDAYKRCFKALARLKARGTNISPDPNSSPAF